MGKAFWVARIVVGGSAAELGKGPGMIRLHMVHHEIIDLLRGNHLGDIAQELPGKGRLGSVDEGDLFSHHEISVVAHPMGQGPDPFEEVGGSIIYTYPKDPRAAAARDHREGCSGISLRTEVSSQFPGEADPEGLASRKRGKEGFGGGLSGAVTRKDRGGRFPQCPDQSRKPLRVDPCQMESPEHGA